MNLTHSIEQLIREVGPGKMRSAAYDTAWVARLAKLGEPMGFQALDWLREHQLPDGSWGAKDLPYFHDRLVCTLAAAIALAENGDERDTLHLQRAKNALATVIPQLADKAMIETIGFELIVPTLFNEAEAHNLIQRRHYHIMDVIDRLRMAKLAKLPGGVINRYVTLAFSAEMAGADGMRLLDIERLQENNGSLGHSPSATAYYALYIERENPQALNYLRSLPNADGGIPDVYPFDVFEPAWVLWNLSFLTTLDDDLLSLCQPHLDFLENAWNTGPAVGFAADYTPKDSDDSSIAYEVLMYYGRDVDVSPLLDYELSEYFRCYALEANPSVNANVHMLGALRRAGYPLEHPSIQKIVNFLQSAQYWFDKWHVSPYYPTAHAVLACAGYADFLVADAIDWMLSTQNEDGSWGYFLPTAEETAYCLQALAVWRRTGHRIPEEVLQHGADWLMAHTEPPFPPLWIGKCLYSPTRVIESTILSALALVTEALGVSLC